MTFGYLEGKIQIFFFLFFDKQLEIYLNDSFGWKYDKRY